MSNSTLPHSLDQRMLAHDLRHLLALARGHAELLEASLQESGTSDEVASSLGAIRLAVTRATELCEDTMRFSTPADPQMDWKSAKEGGPVLPLCTRIAELAQEHAIKAGVALTVEIDPSLAGARLDAQAIAVERAVLNLYWNALEAVQPPDGALELAFLRRSKQLEIQIRDNGAGLPAELLGSLLEHRPEGKGNWGQSSGGSLHGLGLVIAAFVARRYSGSLEGVKRECGGAELRLRLPMLAAESA